jgi:Mn-dependent DtxR family transcriptional regulator
MVQRMDAGALLKYEKYRGLVLTAAGEAVARNITRRHQLLTQFLTLLGLDQQVIHHDVEGMEHHISPSTIRAIEALTEQLRRRPALRAKLGRS